MNLARAFFISFAALFLVATSSAALSIGQVDDFEDGTVQNWIVAPLGQSHPQPPVNVPTGGPAGADDNYLQLTSIGGMGAGGRLVAINLMQWAGDYAGIGVNAIELDLLNMGATDLFIRILLEDPTIGPPENVAATTNAVFLPAGGGWTHGMLSVRPEDLTVLLGNVTTLLANTTAIRIFSSPTPTFPPDPVNAQLGVDNIRALSVSTPVEAGSWGRIKGLFR